MPPALRPQLTGWDLALLAVGMLAVSEVGYWFGKRIRRPEQEAKQTHLGIVLAALLALLGLLLAFSFSAVEKRFAERRALVLEDANSIGTVYLRAEMLPQPYDARIQALLRRYTQYRVQATNAEELERAIARSTEVHAEMWTQATEVARANPESQIVALFVRALNDMFDLHESRVTLELHQRLPAAVLWMLYIVAFVSIGMLGFGTGLGRKRSMVTIAVLVVVITAVMALIVDLDRPAGRLFHISQAAMADTRRSMAPPPQQPQEGAASSSTTSSEQELAPTPRPERVQSPPRRVGS